MATLLAFGRCLIALMFLSSGTAALTDIGGTALYFAEMGLPEPRLAAIGTGIFEVLAGALLVAGFMTRPVAFALAAFSIAATFLGHYGHGDGQMAFWHMQMFLKDLAIAGGLVAFGVFGPGALSFDERRW